MNECFKISLTEYDRRQIELMRDSILAYEQRRIALGELLNKLEALIDVLQSVGQDWKDQVHSHWLDLEELYSVALDRKENVENYSEHLARYLSNIKDLTSKALQAT